MLFVVAGFLQHPQPLPKIVGKWKVESVTMAEGGPKMTQKENKLLYNQFAKFFTDKTFEFKADQRCQTSVALPDMPNINYWRYDSSKNEVQLKIAKNDDSIIMGFSILEKSGEVFFVMGETPLVLKMHKLNN